MAGRLYSPLQTQADGQYWFPFFLALEKHGSHARRRCCNKVRLHPPHHCITKLQTQKRWKSLGIDLIWNNKTPAAKINSNHCPEQRFSLVPSLITLSWIRQPGMLPGDQSPSDCPIVALVCSVPGLYDPFCSFVSMWGCVSTSVSLENWLCCPY